MFKDGITIWTAATAISTTLMMVALWISVIKEKTKKTYN